MTIVLLAPSYGNPTTRKRYQKTIDGSIRFEDSPYIELLEQDQLIGLRELHPAGTAHFWGAIASHNKDMDRLQTGDVVLFTGDKKVRAAGEVGFRFRNPAFADLLWDQYDEGRSFVNVYTVLNVRTIDRPYSDLWSLDGFNEGDNIMGQRLVTDDRVERIINAFSIATSTAEAKVAAELEAVGHAIETGSRVVPVERFQTDIVWQEVAARKAAYVRIESQLVNHFKRSFEDGEIDSFVTPSGKRADLYRAIGDDVEVIEAKSLAKHEKVREAVAQLLDYAAHSPQPVTRLTALFPQRPAQESVDYLHRLGIDCLYRTDNDDYERESALDARRRYMLPVWRDGE